MICWSQFMWSCHIFSKTTWFKENLSPDVFPEIDKLYVVFKKKMYLTSGCPLCSPLKSPQTGRSSAPWTLGSLQLSHLSGAPSLPLKANEILPNIKTWKSNMDTQKWWLWRCISFQYGWLFLAIFLVSILDFGFRGCKTLVNNEKNLGCLGHIGIMIGWFFRHLPTIGIMPGTYPWAPKPTDY